VKSIVNRVDQVFRERKNACLQMVWEISDLENQLDCLQNNTRDYCEASAIQGANISWSESNVDKLDDDFHSLVVKGLEPANQEYRLLQEQYSEGLFSSHY
jgi:hypothetical protein